MDGVLLINVQKYLTRCFLELNSIESFNSSRDLDPSEQSLRTTVKMEVVDVDVDIK